MIAWARQARDLKLALAGETVFDSDFCAKGFWIFDHEPLGAGLDGVQWEEK